MPLKSFSSPVLAAAGLSPSSCYSVPKTCTFQLSIRAAPASRVPSCVYYSKRIHDVSVIETVQLGAVHCRPSIPPAESSSRLLCLLLSRQGLSVMQLWLSWNSLCRLGWPRTQKSACLCLPSAEIKDMCHRCLANIHSNL